MNIKENIDPTVLKEVAQSVNVTEDLLIKMISTDLHNHMVTVFSGVIAAFIIMITLFFIAYFRNKHTESSLLTEVCCIVGGVIGVVLLAALLGTGVFMNEFEILNNNEYAVVKEINAMYDELKNPTKEESE